MMKEIFKQEHSLTPPPIEALPQVSPLRITLAIGSVALLLGLLLRQLTGSLAGALGLWLDSIVPSLSAMMAMLLLFDALMMMLLRSARPRGQQRIDSVFIKAWLVLCALLSGLLTLHIAHSLP